MKIGVPKEIVNGERRVALIPSAVSTLKKDGHHVCIEANAGSASSHSDAEYKEAGASIIADPAELYGSSDVILKVRPPAMHPDTGRDEVELMREGSSIISFLSPMTNTKTIENLANRRATAFAMEFVPRITRAQSMDALTSMATIAGYKAVLMSANRIGKFFPLFMTAAGTITPSTVLVLGAGVAGLQAIATAKRLGARVEAFDPRPVVKEQVESLGAKFIEMEMPEDVETAGGYAKELSEEFIKKEHEAIAARLPKVDVVITTAQVFGKRAPLLITDEMVKVMRPGSVIVDLAAEQGGNCEITEAGKTVEKNGVNVIGAVNLPASMPVHASQMYAKNITNLFRHIYKSEGKPDFEDEIVKGTCIIRDGEIVNEMVKDRIKV